jgi:ThiF family
VRALAASDLNAQELRRDRTRRWLGLELEERLAGTILVIAGCGGTGSVAATAAAALGVGGLVLCDSDTLEETDLNRLVHVRSGDVGKLKVDALREHIADLHPAVGVEVLSERFPSSAILSKMADSTPVVLGAMDRIKPRVELDIACRHYGLTLIDVGTGFIADGAAYSTRSGGQVLISEAPGPCLMCMAFRDTIGPSGYGPARDDPQPSSMLVNSIVATLAIEALMARLCGELHHNTIRYSSVGPSVTASHVNGDPRCPICGTWGAANVRGLAV